MKSVSIESLGEGGGEEVQGMECEATGDEYHARILLGDGDPSRWAIDLTFANLTNKRGLAVF